MASATPDPKSVAIITGSTRTPRVGPSVAAWVYDTLLPAATSSSLVLAPVDLATFNLPIYDESVIPAMVPSSATFSKPHTIAWSTEIQKHAAYILVTPEYNFGMPGAIKNAIDYLVNEWKGKPIAIVSYGVAGGESASENASFVLGKVGLKVAETKTQLRFAGDHGPELYEAMLKGGLGPETKGNWEKEKSADVLKAFAEIKALLEEKPEVKEEDVAKA
ncbi:flavoprotein-like protein [Podospora appendiculata]|uniref:Flavoprotein-like protein n=1 Tax=Podospora appendiculata TaxID=314037 RepID=A0AAE0XCE9_9PEZI|nr:flavoprotein-like protein [Podospora appendiculata]